MEEKKWETAENELCKEEEGERERERGGSIENTVQLLLIQKIWEGSLLYLGDRGNTCNHPDSWGG